MKTVMYLVRHAATEANLALPPRLQGQRLDLPLAPLGVRQAEATRDFLAMRPIDNCFSSPMIRATQTAEIIAAPHGLNPRPVPGLTECDVGRWEGKDWLTIRREEPDAYERFVANPVAQGYPGGESFAEVYQRVSSTLERLLTTHPPGQALLVIGHHVVNRAYLACLLGLPLGMARQVSLSNCGISVVIFEDGEATVGTLNAAFHLQGIAA